MVEDFYYNISSRFSGNSKLNPSKLLQNLDDIYTGSIYLGHDHLCHTIYKDGSF